MAVMHVLMVGLMAGSNCEMGLCFFEIPNLLRHTRTIADMCRNDESGVMSCCQKVLENEANRAMLDRLNAMMARRVDTKDPIVKIEAPWSEGGYIAAIHTLSLQLWVGTVYLYAQSECVAGHADLKRQIDEVLGFFEEHVWSNLSFVDEMRYVQFHVVSETDIDELLRCILYLFDLLMNSRQHYSDYSTVQGLSVTGKKYKKIK